MFFFGAKSMGKKNCTATKDLSLATFLFSSAIYSPNEGNC